MKSPAGEGKTYNPEQPLQKVIVGWKMIIGVPREDRDWDKLNWGRNLRPAKALLEFFRGDWRTAVDCAEDVYKAFNDKGLDCTLNTVQSRAYQWKQKEETKNDVSTR